MPAWLVNSRRSDAYHTLQDGRRAGQFLMRARKLADNGRLGVCGRFLARP